MSARRRLPRTEERILPATRRSDDRMLAEHWARYRFVAPLLGGRILDAGCGTGYGALEIARGDRVREVVACDNSDEALDLARRYYAHPRIRHVGLDLERERWESALGAFDFIVALEVLEHLHEERFFLDGIEAALGQAGSLWLSTPLGRGRGRACGDPFHVHQLRRDEVEGLLGPHWETRVYGQAGTLIETWTPGRRYYTILIRARRRGSIGGDA